MHQDNRSFGRIGCGVVEDVAAAGGCAFVVIKIAGAVGPIIPIPAVVSESGVGRGVARAVRITEVRVGVVAVGCSDDCLAARVELPSDFARGESAEIGMIVTVICEKMTFVDYAFHFIRASLCDYA